MQPKLTLILAAVLTIPVVLFAAEVWQKSPDSWSEKDCSKLVARSPWAKDTAVTMSGGAMGGPGGGGGGGGRGGRGGGSAGMGGGGGMDASSGGGSGGGGGGRGSGGGGGGMENGPPEVPHVVVRWDSASPMREAMKKVSVSKAVEDEDVKAFYIITVDGIRMPGGGRNGDSQRAPQTSGPRRLPSDQADRLKETTTLAAKGKESISPAQIVAMTGEDGKMTFRYYFPRSADFSLDDKEVVFQTRLMRFEVKQKFLMKDMIFDGKLAL